MSPSWARVRNQDFVEIGHVIPLLIVALFALLYTFVLTAQQLKG